ncbi:MAG: hypothetical protein SGILL_008791 [Bacillariaceae sp.]
MASAKISKKSRVNEDVEAVLDMILSQDDEEPENSEVGSLPEEASEARTSVEDKDDHDVKLIDKILEEPLATGTTPPDLQRRAPMQTTQEPGAIPVSGSRSSCHEDPEAEEEGRFPSVPNSDDAESPPPTELSSSPTPLLMATLVQEDKEEEDGGGSKASSSTSTTQEAILVEATPSSEYEKGGKSHRFLSKRTCSIVLIVLLLNAAILGTVLAVIGTRNPGWFDKSSSDNDQEGTAAPTTQQQSLDGSLPWNETKDLFITAVLEGKLSEQTQAMIEDDGHNALLGGLEASPHIRAIQWLYSDKVTDDLFERHDPSTPDRLLQRFALAVFYYSTNGDYWARNDHWLSSDKHECEWYSSLDGGSCHENNELYRGIELFNNNVTGSLPDGVMHLFEATLFLSLEGNPSLGGTLPSELGQMGSIEYLVLPYLNLTGTIPDLSQLTALEELALDNNDLTGDWTTSRLQESAAQSSLEYLFLFNNPRLGGSMPQEWVDLPQLRKCSKNFLPRKWHVLRYAPRLPFVLFLPSTTTVQFVIGNTSITGTIPSELCDTSDNLEIIVNCSNVQCDCCECVTN